MGYWKSFIGVCLAIAVIGVLSMGKTPRPLYAEPNFVGDSTALEKTRIVATLDAPLEDGMNTIWCASFVAAWKSLEAEITKAPIALEGNPEIATALNNAVDPHQYMPEGSLYTAAGWNDKGIIAQITSDLSEKFPGKSPPVFPGIAESSFVAYAYLEAGVKFAIPYFQNREPIQFTDESGITTDLDSFGIRFEDDYAYYDLRQQVEVLYKVDSQSDPETGNTSLRPSEFVLDLDKTSPVNQIVLASIEPEATLEKTLEAIEAKVNSPPKYEGHRAFIPNDVLLVPDMVWDITHHFAELEGRTFSNEEMKGQRIDVAQQDIQFTLNRSGAELRSESKVYYAPIPSNYIFDRPFLLYMKKRGAETPYFVMWVANAELLNRWTGE